MKPDRLVKSAAQEQRAADALGGQRQPQSGAGKFRKNDVRSDRFLVECKRTDNKRGITLNVTDLRALHTNAVLESRIPVLHVEVDGMTWVAVPDWAFEELTDGQ